MTPKRTSAGRFSDRKLRLLLLGVLLASSGLAPASAAVARPAAPSATAEAPNCIELFSIDNVYSSASPNVGSTTYGVRVVSGTTVQLRGIAERLSFTLDCGIVRTSLPPSWRLLRQTYGGEQSDATGSLSSTSDLNPTFVASGRGVYFAEIRAAGRIWTTPVEVITTRNGHAWYSIGPDGGPVPNSPEVPTQGRINGIAIDPTNSSVLYAASAAGGVWRSTNAGANWFPMSEHKNFPTLSTSAVAVTANGTVYVGAGDLHPGGGAGIGSTGAGLFRSTDRGVSWTQVGATTSGCPAGSMLFSGLALRILPHPSDPSIIFVASTAGLYRSTDAGACWRTLGSFAGTVMDVAFKPGTPTTLYVATLPRHIYRTTAATTATPSFTSLTLPDSLQSSYTRLVLAVTPAAPNNVYAALVATSADFIVSTNGGDNWTRRTSVCNAWYCYYVVALAVSPVDSQRVIFGNIGIQQSWDTMTSWNNLRGESIHADIQALAFDPNNPNLLYAASDGGIYRQTIIPCIRGVVFICGIEAAWQSLNFRLTTHQGAMLAISPLSPAKGAIGLWDNGTKRRVLGTTWESIADNDGAQAAVDAGDPNVIYHSLQAAAGGEFIRFVEQIVNVFFFTIRVRSSTDMGGVSPTESLYSDPRRIGRLYGFSVNNVGGAPRSGGRLYVADGTNTAASAAWRCADPAPGSGGGSAVGLEFAVDGSLYLARDNGRVYHFIVPPPPLSNIGTCSAGSTNATGVELIYSEPSARPLRIAVDPNDANTLYAVVPGRSDSGRVLVLRRVSGSWTATPVAGTPGAPGALPTVSTALGSVSPNNARSMVPFAADPSDPGVLWLGTTRGLWMGLPQQDGSYQWSLDLSVPETPITEIVPHRSSGGFSGVLQLFTYGRGVWERYYRPTVRLSAIISSGVVCVSCVLSRDPIDAPKAGSREKPSPYYVLLAIPYENSKGQDLVLRITPLSEGKDQSAFFEQAPLSQVVAPGEGTAFFELLYNAANANNPLGVGMDSLAIELTDLNAAVIVSDTVPLENYWLREDARRLLVASQVEGVHSFVANAPIEVVTSQQTGGQPLIADGRLVGAVSSGEQVTVTAPSTIKLPDGEVGTFGNWLLNGEPVTQGQALQANLSYTLVVTDDAELVARYLLPEGEELKVRRVWLPLITR